MGLFFSIIAAKLVTACVYGGYRSSQPAALLDSCLVCKPFPGRPLGHSTSTLVLPLDLQLNRHNAHVQALRVVFYSLGCTDAQTRDFKNYWSPGADSRAPALMSVGCGLGMGEGPLIGSAEQHYMGNTVPGNLFRNG